MADENDIAPPTMPATAQTPFGIVWPPPDWGAAAPAPVQPGLGGIPTSALDAAMPTPPVQPGLGLPSGAIDAAAANAQPTPDLPHQGGPSLDALPEWGTREWMLGLAAPAAKPEAAPDAISGAAATPVAALAGDVTSEAPPNSLAPDVAASDLERTNAARAAVGLAPLTGRLAGKPEETDAETDSRYRSMNDDDLDKDVIMRQQAAAHQADIDKLDSLSRDREAAELNFRTRVNADAHAQQFADKINTDATALAAQNIDNDHWWNSRSTGQKVSGYISAILGGMMAPQYGGRNVGLEQINKAIEQDLETQKSNLANKWRGIDERRGYVHDLFAQNQNAYQAAETFRIASLDRVDKELAIKQNDYDRRGQTFAQIELTRRQVQAKKAAAIEAARRNAFDEYIKAGDLATKKFSAETARLAEDAKARLEASKMKGVGAGAGKPKEEPVYGSEYPTLGAVPEKFRHLAFRLPDRNGKPGGYAIANNPKTQEEAGAFVPLYDKANYDADQMQRISLRRKGAMSAAGGFNSAWRDTDEQHYESLMTDLANTYGMLIHGRAPTAGVLEEVMTKSAPELKPFWKSGDTTELLNRFRNDVDNRATLQLHSYGYDGRVSSDRPKIETPNVNTIKAPWLAPPVVGANGYAHTDVGNFDASLRQQFDKYVHAPSLGGQKAYESDLDDAYHAQTKAIADISSDMSSLAAKKKRTPEEDARLHTAPAALADRAEMLRAINDARKLSVSAVARDRAAAAANEVERERSKLTPGARRF